MEKFIRSEVQQNRVSHFDLTEGLSNSHHELSFQVAISDEKCLHVAQNCHLLANTRHPAGHVEIYQKMNCDKSRVSKFDFSGCVNTPSLKWHSDFEQRFFS